MKTFPGYEQNPSRLPLVAGIVLLLLFLAGAGACGKALWNRFAVSAPIRTAPVEPVVPQPAELLRDTTSPIAHIPFEAIKIETLAATPELAEAIKPPIHDSDPEAWLKKRIAELEAEDKARELALRPRAIVFPAPSSFPPPKKPATKLAEKIAEVESPPLPPASEDYPPERKIRITYPTWGHYYINTIPSATSSKPHPKRIR